jgi:hypothetical protein
MRWAGSQGVDKRERVRRDEESAPLVLPLIDGDGEGDGGGSATVEARE